jgi:hypothetical protein
MVPIRFALLEGRSLRGKNGLFGEPSYNREKDRTFFDLDHKRYHESGERFSQATRD